MKIDIYVVVEFGCNSSCNDMYPPKVSVFNQKEEAYEFYNKLKNEILKMKESYEISYKLYKQENGECIIQNGGYEGAKRPIAVMITHS